MPLPTQIKDPWELSTATLNRTLANYQSLYHIYMYDLDETGRDADAPTIIAFGYKRPTLNSTFGWLLEKCHLQKPTSDPRFKSLKHRNLSFVFQVDMDLNTTNLILDLLLLGIKNHAIAKNATEHVTDDELLAFLTNPTPLELSAITHAISASLVRFVELRFHPEWTQKPNSKERSLHPLLFETREEAQASLTDDFRHTIRYLRQHKIPCLAGNTGLYVGTTTTVAPQLGRLINVIMNHPAIMISTLRDHLAEEIKDVRLERGTYHAKKEINVSDGATMVQ